MSKSNENLRIGYEEKLISENIIYVSHANKLLLEPGNVMITYIFAGYFQNELEIFNIHKVWANNDGDRT